MARVKRPKEQTARAMDGNIYGGGDVYGDGGGDGDVYGIDEAGRGALAGPVAAAVVQLGSRYPRAYLQLLRDSKALTAQQREARAAEIIAHAARWAVAWASNQEIDQYNVLQATLLAMRRAWMLLWAHREARGEKDEGAIVGAAGANVPDIGLASAAKYEGGLSVSATPVVIVDGPHAPDINASVQAVIKADAFVPAVQAASILAKTHRDAWMVAAHARYSHYQFDRHKGYPTALHRALITRHGQSPLHRRSFRAR